ncbi:formate--tetrahydrofolate ligase [Thermodesulfobium sp.]
MTDYEISKNANLKKIFDIAKKYEIPTESLKPFGDYVSKVDYRLLYESKSNFGKLIFVTGITPTPYGEGKTTTAIGLVDALNRLGYRSLASLRQPSLGPIFGIKGGATGGGYAQVVPMDEINLLFTGDFPAIEYANNLLASLIDNHIYHGNQLGIDSRKIKFRRAMDMNDRSLRSIVIGLGGSANGFPREAGFDITAASEVMAILGLSLNINDLKKKLGNILVGFSYDKKPIYAKDLLAEGAMAAILRNAINPNLVQTLENNLVFVHGGPFANIAHGTSSILSIKLALKYSDYAVVEGGFATDLGGEKFLDIIARLGEFKICAVVIVATTRALKYHGGLKLNYIEDGNKNLIRGLQNLEKHIENMQTFGLKVVVALNKFSDDTDEEIKIVRNFVESMGVGFALSDVWANGGKGGEELAKKIIEIEEERIPRFIYKLEQSPKEKIEKIAKTIYGASSVEYSQEAEADLKDVSLVDMENSFVCIAKTPLSLSADPKLIGRPEDFKITVREVRISHGANFIVPVLGKIMTMPGLPKVPQAVKFDILESGEIQGI